MSFNDIFPLPASPFEEYLLRDERPGYPMTTPHLFMFRGNVNVHALEEAFNKAISHEPMMCAIVQWRNGRPHWIASAEPPRLLTKMEPMTEGLEQIVSLDITKQPGVHCVYIPTAEGFAIRLQIHHAVCDGLGTVSFFGNWMAEYASLIGDDAGLTAPPTIPIRIKERTNFHIEQPHSLSQWTITKSFLKQLYIWFGRSVYKLSVQDTVLADKNLQVGNRPPGGCVGDSRLESLAEVRSTARCRPAVGNLPSFGAEFIHQGSNPIANPVLLWKSIPNEDIIRLRQRAKSLGVSLNSYLTGLYFQHLCCWIGTHKESDSRWLRLLVPTNLRKPVHTDIPSANMIGYAFFDRRPSECTDSEAFYQSIDKAVDIIKKWSMGTMFMSGLEIVRRIPFAFPWILSSRRCLATSVFSNIGNPCKMLPYQRFRESGTIEVGGAKLYRMIGAPPVRPNTPFCGGVIQQNEETTLSMIVDTPKMGLEHCRRYYEDFIEMVLDKAT